MTDQTTSSARCPGCGHSCCPHPSHECGGDSDTVRACEGRTRRSSAIDMLNALVRYASEGGQPPIVPDATERAVTFLTSPDGRQVAQTWALVFSDTIRAVNMVDPEAGDAWEADGATIAASRATAALLDRLDRLAPDRGEEPSAAAETAVHRFDPGYTGMSETCNALVLRDGHGDDCGLPRSAHVAAPAAVGAVAAEVLRGASARLASEEAEGRDCCARAVRRLLDYADEAEQAVTDEESSPEPPAPGAEPLTDSERAAAEQILRRPPAKGPTMSDRIQPGTATTAVSEPSSECPGCGPDQAACEWPPGTRCPYREPSAGRSSTTADPKTQQAGTAQTVEQFISACEKRFAEREAQPGGDGVRPDLAYARLIFTEVRGVSTPPGEAPAP